MHPKTQVPLLRILVLPPLHAWPILIQHVEVHLLVFYHHQLQGIRHCYRPGIPGRSHCGDREADPAHDRQEEIIFHPLHQSVEGI